MPNQLNNVKVAKVSFVGRAAVRDPDQPDQPRRFVLYKSDGSPDDERTDDMLSELEKRAIDRPATEPPASDGLLTLDEIERRQGHYADLLAELEGDMRKMRRDGTPLHVLQRHENAHRDLAHAYKGLDAQRGLAESGAPMVKSEDSMPIRK